MTIIIEILVIFLFSFIGDLISSSFNLPIPGSIIGLLLLFLALYSKVIKIKDINRVGKFLQKNMALLFVPLTVGMMNYFDIIKSNLLMLTVAILMSTSITYFATGKSAQLIQKKEDHHE